MAEKPQVELNFASNGAPAFAAGQTLLMDADDTLWENNIYFERAIAAFISYLDHKEYTREQVRATLNEVERENVRLHGYGLVSFRRALVTCFERLTQGPIPPEKHERIESFAQSIADEEIDLLAGVAETLPILASRHKLILVTKGNQDEQLDKLARSGVAHHFAAVEVPREKDPGAYRSVCEKYQLAADTTWMIGNSPRSDINPALACGLHAVYIHHPHTWVLEHDELDAAPAGQRLLEISEFAHLLRYF
ncbi:MAG TPA: HAD family hydrolase [Acidobacteriaceae bacterium]|jgi:putative hydrolase of the HAD superfamily|nr:HAD family hydrolase [Acidobacteriaceae bacterium]